MNFNCTCQQENVLGVRLEQVIESLNGLFAAIDGVARSVALLEQRVSNVEGILESLVECDGSEGEEEESNT